MQTEITLSRSQILKLSEYITHFKEVQTATIISSNTSGIGESIVVNMDFSTPETIRVDLTEYERW